DGAAVQHDLVADGDMGADSHGKAVIGVQDGAILDVGAFADDDGIVVAANDHVEPDADILGQLHRADHGGIVCDVEVVTTGFDPTLAQCVHHADLPSSVFTGRGRK